MKKAGNYGIMPLVLRACVQYFKAAKGWSIAEHGISVIHALSWTAGIIAAQILFDAIIGASMGTLDFWHVAAALGVFAAIAVGQQFLNGAGNYLIKKVSYTNVGIFMAEFQRKLGRLPAIHFENPEFLNDVNKARECLEYESLGQFTFVCLYMVTSYLVFFGSIGGYLFWLSPLLPLIIVAAFIPALLGQLAQVKVFAALEEANAPLRRRCEYYRNTIAHRTFFKETRMLGGFRFFHRLFIESLFIITKKTWQTERKAALLRLLLNTVSFLGLGASILMLFTATMNGSISVGAFAAVFASLSQIFSVMDEVVSNHLSEASESFGQVANYYRLMDMEEVGGKDTAPDFAKGITAHNLHFTYPGRNEPAVHGINLSIKAGQTIAIVGANGAGKSTLVRLLVGLYIPDTGTVEIGGADTKNTHPNTLFKDISGVFQNYQRYKMTLAENVAISSTQNPPNTERIRTALSSAEFNEQTAALDTMLSPEFNGIDLSGGQWQRLAIARGLYRLHDFIVLDEPTAAIDPIEEARVYNQFRRLSQGKCAIIVTHRLGSAKLADRIVVMDNGTIADIGTHDELLERKGTYATMWQAQTAWYDTSPV